jgi:hypothetical protein
MSLIGSKVGNWVRQSGAVGSWLEPGSAAAVLGAGVDAASGVTTDGAYVQEGAALDMHPARRSAAGKSGRRRLMYDMLLSKASALQAAPTHHGAGKHRQFDESGRRAPDTPDRDVD